MKIYLYDPETGIYQGEDFIDASSMTAARKLPRGATIVPPPPYDPGLVPVYREGLRNWQILSSDELKTIVECEHEHV